jgi:hypothetical protein
MKRMEIYHWRPIKYQLLLSTQHGMDRHNELSLGRASMDETISREWRISADSTWKGYILEHTMGHSPLARGVGLQLNQKPLAYL